MVEVSLFLDTSVFAALLQKNILNQVTDFYISAPKCFTFPVLNGIVFRPYSNNGFIITWILHQIFMFHNKVNSVAGKKNPSPSFTPFPPLLLDKWPDQ